MLGFSRIHNSSLILKGLTLDLTFLCGCKKFIKSRINLSLLSRISDVNVLKMLKGYSLSVNLDIVEIEEILDTRSSEVSTYF